MKKVVSLLLVLVLALGMSSVAFAASAKINKDSSVTGNNGFSNLSGLDTDEIKADYHYSEALDVNDFAWATSASAPSVPASMGKTQVSASKLTVKAKVKKGSNIIDEFGIEYPTAENKEAHLYLDFVKHFKSNNTDGLDFEITLYPVVDGRNWNDKGVDLIGTIINDVIDVDGDFDYVDMEPNTIAKCTEYCKSLEYYMGEGVSVFGRAIKGQKYWGVANKDTTVKEDEIMTAKGIDEVYHLNNIGLATVATKVVLADADPAAYVYDGNFKYLGKASEDLPFAETYYLSSKQLDEDDEGDEPEEEEEEDVPVAPPVTGGDDGYPVENTNDNPSTGK